MFCVKITTFWSIIFMRVTIRRNTGRNAEEMKQKPPMLVKD